MSYRVLLIGFLHHKNLNALLKYKNMVVTKITAFNPRMDFSKFDVVYSPSNSIDVSLYPTVKFIFGPHFSVFPQEQSMQMITGPNSIYIQPSQWTIDFWKPYSICDKVSFKVLPFGVDTDVFTPQDMGLIKTNVFIYFKRRRPDELRFVQELLDSMGVSYRIFVYGSYSEDDYKSYLQTCKYGIWLDAHESQGFALEEALSMNVPLFVWNVRLLSQEYGSNYPHVFATTIPYWDSICGEVVYLQHEFLAGFSTFLSNLSNYRPREFVLNHISLNICQKRLIDLICN